MFRKLLDGRALYVTPDKIWVARGRKFFAVDYDGKRVSKVFTVPGGLKEKLMTCGRILTQGTRNDIRILLPLRNGNLMVVAKRKVLLFSPDGEVVSTWTGFQGNKPGHQGACVTPDGTVFFAEYLLNPNRDHTIRLWRSRDNGMTWHTVKEFEPGDIRHLHFVKWDVYAQCLWMGTGDYGEGGSENRLYQSIDNGETWRLVGQGSQDWRAIGVCTTEDALLWGTDAGSCPDTVHFVRMNRKTETLEVLDDMEGPCHGMASFADGRAFFSTGVEGGENEKDDIARMKQLGTDGKLHTVWECKKDILPLIVQYGVMRFPLGTDNCNKVVFTCMALKGHGETVMIEK
ncbi:MAG: hypothetical protein HUK00_00070 [Bacteroidaceae bacterium]|nr:hypothetical protein [Bacteroidaceae bacterium]